MVAGLIEKKGSGYEVRSRTLETVAGKIVTEVSEEVSDKQSVLRIVEKIAARTRHALGDPTPESVQLKAAGIFTTSSLEAAHAYALAEDLSGAGKFEEAKPLYEQAIQFDPNLGRAYAAIVAMSANMGRTKDVEKYYQLALMHADRMSDREKYRMRGSYYLLNREPRKAMEEYSALVQRFPSDGVGYSNLALAYFYRRDMPKALEQGRHAVELLPKSMLHLANLALYAIYAGDFTTAADQARLAIAERPSSPDGYGVLAMAQTGQGQFSEADQTYQKMETISARDAPMATTGRADQLLYQGRTKEAIALLQKALNSASGKLDNSTLAVYLILLGEAKLAAGKVVEAATDAKSALAHSDEGSVQFFAGRIYIEAGQTDAAQPLVSQLFSRPYVDYQAYAKLLEGELYLGGGDAKRAVALFEDAQKLADTWLGHFDLGRAYVEMSAFPKADSEIEECLKRRGEASALFLDDVPTFRALPPVYYYLGRAQQGLMSPASMDSFKIFLSIKEKGDEVGLVRDAQMRIAGH